MLRSLPCEALKWRDHNRSVFFHDVCHGDSHAAGVSGVLPDTTGFDGLRPITLDQSDSNLILV